MRPRTSRRYTRLMLAATFGALLAAGCLTAEKGEKNIDGTPIATPPKVDCNLIFPATTNQH